jgi:hypothetical protein
MRIAQALSATIAEVVRSARVLALPFFGLIARSLGGVDVLFEEFGASAVLLDDASGAVLIRRAFELLPLTCAPGRSVAATS